MVFAGSASGITDCAVGGDGIDVSGREDCFAGVGGFSTAATSRAVSLALLSILAARGRSKFIKSTEPMMTHRQSAMSAKEFLLKILRRANLPLIVIGFPGQSEEIDSMVGGFRSVSGGLIVINSYDENLAVRRHLDIACFWRHLSKYL